ncbi:MAG: FHA domain-containing protein, partial [Planctomycetota bacterium]
RRAIPPRPDRSTVTMTPAMAEESPTLWYPNDAAGQPRGGVRQPAGRSTESSVARIALSLRQTSQALGRPEEETVPGQPPTADRRLLWVDGVGGYQLVLSEEVTLGRGSPGSPNPPTIALRATLFADHARLTRRDGAYLLTPLGPTQVDGHPVEGPTALGADARIDLLASDGHRPVSLRLRRPHPLSATAVLTVESGHRTEPMVDAVLLMAESCILGGGPQSHVRCPDASADAVLHRDGSGAGSAEPLATGLACRTPTGGGRIVLGERFEGQDVAFCVEQEAGT